MSGGELAARMDWAAQEGWNPGLRDAETFHATDPQGLLLDALMSRVPAGGQLQFDVSAEHEAARALATDRGMQPVFETARMYTGPAPAMDLSRQFGITTFELG